MPGALFAELVGHLLESMGQSVERVRQIPEGLLLATSDGFVYAFLEDPRDVSLESVERLFSHVPNAPRKLVVLTPGQLPPALLEVVLERRATLVEGERFHELARGLGLASYLGEEPRAAVPTSRRRLLPSAHQLDEVMTRARSWLERGVPALALRFYRQASNLKPEFLPAQIGTGKALFLLGLYDDAHREFDLVLEAHPGDVDAQMGNAAILGAAGHPEQELSVYRSLLGEAPERVDLRVQLIAGLIELGHWAEARDEITTMLLATPEEPRLRFLLSVALEKSGSPAAGRRELARARSLGLDFAQESTLCRQVGLPPPMPSAPPSSGRPEAEKGLR
ncbi:MAG: tetratricopeptide repeat protein, partial [Candidatus Lutacidiplasmatales archaeon]